MSAEHSAEVLGKKVGVNDHKKVSVFLGLK
jgi:hypothetical protein